jgi:flagellar basal body P-ring protein FlgI
MNKNITTIDQLAKMINEGFKTTATKEDVKALEDRVTARLDRIETLLMEEQKRKLENLETRVKRLEGALAV